MDFKYKGDIAVGSTWKRAASVIVYNELDQVPRVAFGEQHVVEIDGQILTRDVGSLSVLVTPDVMYEEFAILNADGEPTGQTTTVLQLAALMASAYVHFADKRDIEDKAALEEVEREEEGSEEEVDSEEEGSEVEPDPAP